MLIDSPDSRRPHSDGWLEAQCRRIQEAGHELALTVGEVNERTQQARVGRLGRRQRITEEQLEAAETAWKTLHEQQIAMQNAVFDTEHELRELREREVNPAELLIEGEDLIRHYRFLRRRARIIDALLAYLPAVSTLASTCIGHLRRLHEGVEMPELLVVPDCTFAILALEQLREEEGRG